MPHQPSLFPDDDASRGAASPARAALEERFERLRPIAEALPSTVRFGTSSWGFPGWAGLVYTSNRAAASLAREGLREYARNKAEGSSPLTIEALARRLAGLASRVRPPSARPPRGSRTT